MFSLCQARLTPPWRAVPLTTEGATRPPFPTTVSHGRCPLCHKAETQSDLPTRLTEVNADVPEHRNGTSPKPV